MTCRKKMNVGDRIADIYTTTHTLYKKTKASENPCEEDIFQSVKMAVIEQ